MKKIRLLQDVGTSKAGTIFVRGDLSFGVPKYYKHINSEPKDWYWEEGSEEEENLFLFKTTLAKKYYEEF